MNKDILVRLKDYDNDNLIRCFHSVRYKEIVELFHFMKEKEIRLQVPESEEDNFYSGKEGIVKEIEVRFGSDENLLAVEIWMEVW